MEPKPGLGGRLHRHRIRLALWIAAAEGIFVYFAEGTTKWSVFALALVATVLWFIGRNTDSNSLRQVLWIFAASQLLAVLLVLLTVIVKWAVILGLIACIVAGIVFLFLDRR